MKLLNSKIIGKFKYDSYYDQTEEDIEKGCELEPMNQISSPIKINFLEQEIRFEIYDEEVLEKQISEIDTAIENFLNTDKKKLKKLKQLIFKNYKEEMSYYEDEEDEEELEALPKIKNKKDVFKYITLISICISIGQDDEIIVELIAECEWEIEHGLRVDFQNGDKIIRVGICD